MASKRIEIYQCPSHLIIHLKRFKHQTPTLFTAASKKLTNLVSFPVEGLDLHEYAANGGVYDLYAVSNHTGNLKNGHYTAYCLNPINRNWYLFDDHKVTPVAADKVVTKQAYVLFYKLRN